MTLEGSERFWADKTNVWPGGKSDVPVKTPHSPTLAPKTGRVIETAPDARCVPVDVGVLGAGETVWLGGTGFAAAFLVLFRDRYPAPKMDPTPIKSTNAERGNVKDTPGAVPLVTWE